MPKPNIFISHQWRYNEGYLSLKDKFLQREWKHSDYSVPEHDPFDLIRTQEIEEALQEQIRRCNFFIVFARMAANNSDWVRKEVEYALKFNKAGIGVRPYRYTGNIPAFIQDNFQISGFNTPAIIRLIENTLGS